MTNERKTATAIIKMDPTKRFSTRAQYYNKYRPKYPRAIIKLLRAECGLSSSSIIADIGSGTGILSRLFLKNDNIPFLKAYDNLLYKFGIDYKEVNQQIPDERNFAKFFGHDSFQLKIFHNFQVFNFDSLKGRVLSSSYAPMKGHPNYEQMMRNLHRIFLEYQSDSKVRFEYDTKVYYGQFK